MARVIKRRFRFTTCDVVDENGELVAVMRVLGKLSAPRMANIARRDRANTLLSVRNLRYSACVYGMDEGEFMAHAVLLDEQADETDETETDEQEN